LTITDVYFIIESPSREEPAYDVDRAPSTDLLNKNASGDSLIGESLLAGVDRLVSDTKANADPIVIVGELLFCFVYLFIYIIIVIIEHTDVTMIGESGGVGQLVNDNKTNVDPTVIGELFCIFIYIYI
jgi:hypothetical protein